MAKTAGYSGTPLPRKLGVKPGHRLVLAHAPWRGWPADYGALPDDVTVVAGLRGTAPADVIVAFFMRARDLERRFPPLAARLKPDGALWIAWPKLAAREAQGLDSDLSDNTVREIGLAAGLVDVKVCAIDETWSGLKFVIRVKDRPKG